MFTTGSKLFLGATVAVDGRGHCVRRLQRRRRTAGSARSACCQCGGGVRRSFAASTSTPATATCSAMSESASLESPAAQPPVERSMWPALARCRRRRPRRRCRFASRSSSRSASSCCSPRRSSGWCRAGANGQSADAAYNASAAQADAASDRVPRRSPPSASPRSSTRSRASCCGSTRAVVPWCSSITGALILFGGFVFAVEADPQARAWSPACARSVPLGLVSVGAVIGHRRAAPHRARTRRPNPTTEPCATWPRKAKAIRRRSTSRARRTCRLEEQHRHHRRPRSRRQAVGVRASGTPSRRTRSRCRAATWST